MNIAILIFSSPAGEKFTAVDRLIYAGEQLGHTMIKLYEPFLSCREGRLLHDGAALPPIDVIISRPNYIEEPGVHAYAAELLIQNGYRVINHGTGIAWSKNKILQHLYFQQHHLPCPRWGIARTPNDLNRIAEEIGYPVVMKVPFGTHGTGVFYADKVETLKPIADYLAVRDANPVIIEEFIREAQNKDIRVFVLGGKVLAAMERTAPKNDVRANTSIGGTGASVTLTHEEEQLAQQLTNAFELEIAGVDLIRSSRGTLLLEINANPGFTELERVTGLDVASAIIEYAVHSLSRRERIQV